VKGSTLSSGAALTAAENTGFLMAGVGLRRPATSTNNQGG
jgi:hypothetical protein